MSEKLMRQLCDFINIYLAYSGKQWHPSPFALHQRTGRWYYMLGVCIRHNTLRRRQSSFASKKYLNNNLSLRHPEILRSSQMYFLMQFRNENEAS